MSLTHFGDSPVHLNPTNIVFFNQTSCFIACFKSDVDFPIALIWTWPIIDSVSELDIVREHYFKLAKLVRLQELNS